MSLWLLDASVILATEDVDDDNHTAAVALLSGETPLVTLDLAFYEVTNVAIRAWRDHSAAGRLSERVAAISEDGGIVRADARLLAAAAAIAADVGISAYDAAYVAAAHRTRSRLVSCDVRDLVSRGLACLPAEAVTDPSDQP